MENREIDSTVHAEEPVFSFRKLNATDLFLMVQIISKIGINEFASCINSPHVIKLIKDLTDKKTEDAKANNTEFIVGVGVALEFANKILMHLPDCQKEIFTLLANVSGMAEREIAGLDAEVFFEMLIAFIKKDEFPNFIKVASKYFK